MTKKICALTMVRNDEFFLRKWVDYYGSQFGSENLRIYFDGEDQVVPDFCDGIPTMIRHREPGKVARADRGRINFLSSEAESLFAEGYDLVVGTDVDEFLVIDPNAGISLSDYLSRMNIKTSVSPLGIDVGQVIGEEPHIDADKKFLYQRSRAVASSRYTKSSVIARPVKWGSGFHRVRGHNFHISHCLYLFHFGGFDRDMIERKLADSDLQKKGWVRHLKKRLRTSIIVSSRKAREWDKTMSWVRRLQQWIRPIYAWNKPWNPRPPIVVEIPPRFRDVL